MKPKFLCPHCEAHLLLRDNIILKVVRNNQQKSIFLLNPDLGNYTYISSPDFKFEKGEQVEFLCPVCCKNLAAKKINNKLVTLSMIGGDGKEYNVYFSSIVGEQSTFILRKNNIIESYGKHSSAYLEYFARRLEERL